MAEKVLTKQDWEAKEIGTQVVWCQLRCPLGQGSKRCVSQAWAVRVGGDCRELRRACPSKQDSCHVDLLDCCCVRIRV